MRKSNLIQARTALPKGHSKEENLVLGKSETLRRSARIQAKGIAFESARTDKPDCSKRSVVQEVQCLTCDKTFGNKKDLEDEREVTFLEASRFAQENGLMFLETSAKTGQCVEEAFLQCSKNILAKIETGELDPERIGSGKTT